MKKIKYKLFDWEDSLLLIKNIDSLVGHLFYFNYKELNNNNPSLLLHVNGNIILYFGSSFETLFLSNYLESKIFFNNIKLRNFVYNQMLNSNIKYFKDKAE